LSAGGFQDKEIDSFVAVSKIGSLQTPGMLAAMNVIMSEACP